MVCCKNAAYKGGRASGSARLGSRAPPRSPCRAPGPAQPPRSRPPRALAPPPRTCSVLSDSLQWTARAADRRRRLGAGQRNAKASALVSLARVAKEAVHAQGRAGGVTTPPRSPRNGPSVRGKDPLHSPPEGVLSFPSLSTLYFPSTELNSTKNLLPVSRDDCAVTGREWWFAWSVVVIGGLLGDRPEPRPGHLEPARAPPSARARTPRSSPGQDSTTTRPPHLPPRQAHTQRTLGRVGRHLPTLVLGPRPAAFALTSAVRLNRPSRRG